MPLRTKRSAEDEDILGDARVDNVHRAHRAARVVERPLLRVGVQPDVGGSVGRSEVCDDVLRHERGVVRGWCGGDGGLRELVQALGVKDVPPVLYIPELTVLRLKLSM